MSSGWDDECSVISDKEKIGFIDFADDNQGKPQSILVGQTSKWPIALENPTDEPVELWGTLTIWLSCKPNDMGLHTTVVHFDVDDNRMERVVFLLAENNVSQSLASTMPYRRAIRRRNQFAVDEYVVSSRPAKPTKRGYRCKIAEYPIPKNIRDLIENKHMPDILAEGLTKENYAAFFSTLLVMEELHLEEEMRTHNMECVMMRTKGRQFVSLEVPGLAERRPSLVHGDFIFAKIASDNSDSRVYQDANFSVFTVIVIALSDLNFSGFLLGMFQGYIYRVEADEVLLKFADEFHTLHRDRNLYNVHFTYNRVAMRRLYQAIEAAQSLQDNLLFPSESTKRMLVRSAPIVPCTGSLNEEQMHSVDKMLAKELLPM
ncbi:P-loop containing nucleoside triphosphate hydrolases superfamily protein isoform 1 [Hibiscus syriacus]|uniref:P-loop containing nucleoside triphosphate hydrolases superfamily protein isoform 1 n=1 Tax=Hibiscus syriacus TaxID=106335 RepID=A0A6A3CNC5_HIBSY|nr:P-loop containing nucleoside triphosphate hydrolases superfamily protein isoform 1 [Hibiscus syriacus]